jgi:ADP-ribose pyrophosphatase YjhB (NUDIX family)
MEQRRYPRIQLPLLVELKHPTLGAHRCIARDISEGGVFVYTDNPRIKAGAKVKLTVQNTLSVETQPTPTVEMEVTRVEPDGLGLAFTNVTGRHLWQSVEQLRTELAIGRDYFQLHLNALVINEANEILLVQQHGKWMFPATFLKVGENWRDALKEFLRRELGIDVTSYGQIVCMNSAGHAEVPEAAVLDVFMEARAATDQCRLAAGSRYKTVRWTDRRRDVEDSTFATDQIRELAEAALKRLVQEEPRG